MTDFASLLRRPSIIHSIDPFRIVQQEAVSKLQALRERGAPFALVASTDFDSEFAIDEYLVALSAVKLPIFTHFPRLVSGQMPVYSSSNGAIHSVILNSKDKFYSSTQVLSRAGASCFDRHLVLNCGALTFGDDAKSAFHVSAEATPYSEGAVDAHLSGLDFNLIQAIYLFSRNGPLPPALCKYARSKIPGHVLLFVSGCITSRDAAETLIEAGANYVVIGTALEHPNWRARLDVLMPLTPS